MSFFSLSNCDCDFVWPWRLGNIQSKSNCKSWQERSYQAIKPCSHKRLGLFCYILTVPTALDSRSKLVVF